MLKEHRIRQEKRLLEQQNVQMRLQLDLPCPQKQQIIQQQQVASDSSQTILPLTTVEKIVETATSKSIAVTEKESKIPAENLIVAELSKKNATILQVSTITSELQIETTSSKNNKLESMTLNRKDNSLVKIHLESKTRPTLDIQTTQKLRLVVKKDRYEIFFK